MEFNSIALTGAKEGRGKIKICGRHTRVYNHAMERKVFWIVFLGLSFLADFVLPLWWGLAATVPIVIIAWWVAYRSDWF